MKLTRCRPVRIVTAAWVAVGICGCSVWPFAERERTSIITPGMRMATVREIGARAQDADSAQQQQTCEQLARQIQTEPDPLVRQEIQNTVAKFSSPLAERMLLAGLSDDDLDVRLTCCHRLAERGNPAAIGPLRQALQSDPELDVRLAAIDALGKIPSTETVAALGIAVKDRDPAVQYAGVQALKAASGEDFGNDVARWQQYVAGETPQPKPDVSVAERVKQWSPF
ncbi:MAG: HEAT repeat domain-containing protein [Pirellulales bacterium]|nr:HEAT repeat domain-containing protein [Pirellulales bacterium]